MRSGNGGTSLAAFVGERIWTGLKPEIRNGAAIRVAIDPRTGQPAEVDNPGTWGTHDEAQTWAATQGGAGAGVAIMLGPVGDTVICGIDLHGCRDTKTGDVAPWAQPVSAAFPHLHRNIPQRGRPSPSFPPPDDRFSRGQQAL